MATLGKTVGGVSDPYVDGQNEFLRGGRITERMYPEGTSDYGRFQEGFLAAAKAAAAGTGPKSVVPTGAANQGG